MPTSKKQTEPMRVIKLDGNSNLFTLCYVDGCDVKPITDFKDKDQAFSLMHKINNSGFAITLTEPSCMREFSIGKIREGGFILKNKAKDLTSALKSININVDFDVEAPAMDMDFLIN